MPYGVSNVCNITPDALALINTECDTALTDYDPPTRTEATADKDAIIEAPGEILESIRSKPETPRKCVMEEQTLLDIRAKIRKHIKDTYEKRLDVPLDAPKPALKCWMELNGE